MAVSNPFGLSSALIALAAAGFWGLLPVRSGQNQRMGSPRVLQARVRGAPGLHQHSWCAHVVRSGPASAVVAPVSAGQDFALWSWD